MRVYCNTCNLNIKTYNWDEHINSEIHRISVFNELPDYSPGEEFISPEVHLNFSIVEQRSKYNQRFKTWQIDYKINISPNINLEQLNDILLELTSTIKQRTLFRNGDKIDLTIINPNLYHPISTRLMTVNDENPIIELGNQLTNILTSNEEISLEECIFHVRVIAIPQGQGRSQKIINLKEDIRTKRCITQITNTDNLCCPRGIVTALTYFDADTFKKLGLLDRELTANDIKKIREGDKYKIQKELALKLLEHCDILIPEPDTGLTIEQIKEIELKLDIQINIICAEIFNSIIYSGQDKSIKVYLYKNENHFDVINSVKAFLGSSYYCDKCKKPYNNKGKHKCVIDVKEKKINRCNVCNSKKHLDKVIENPCWCYCSDCFRYFFNLECFDNHIENNTCDTVWKCKKCEKLLLWKQTSPETHICGENLCKNCNKIQPPDHKCFMLTKPCKGGYCEKEIPCNLIESKKAAQCYSCKTNNDKYLFFDFECTQETGTHIPNLCVVNDFDGNETIFNNTEAFCKWLISKDHINYTAIAHNAKGYDSHFILKYCVENTIKPETIYNGTKLMFLNIPVLGLRIIDSMNFVAQPLSTFPKTFGLKELKKGYFPHYSNKECNRNYIGPIPSKKHYGYNQMRREDRQKFLEWYNEKVNDNYVFDCHKELVDYCRSDVNILRLGCLKLRDEFLKIANIDPFQYITIASVCMSIFRSKYLIKDTIAVAINKESHTDRFSKESICWLDFLMHKENINIQHALNGGEKTILGYKVDGYCDKTNTIYQFHGCFWHGCPKCYDPDFINNKNKKTMRDLYKNTQKISAKLIKDHKLSELWECDFTKSFEIKKYKKIWKREVVMPLNPRDAFYGGRTNATKLLYTCRKSNKIRYIDVCSLYPTVQFYDYYPVGHPNKIFNPDYYDRNWYGLIKCKVLPPRGLYHPVLPVKTHMGKSEKLLFPLCYTCAKTKIQKCNHSDQERAIIGTWTTDEVNIAIKKGYHIEKIYEVWNFNEKSNQLFKEYVKDFMKLKLETSAWKGDFKTVEDYIDAVKRKLDISLEKDKIQDNPGKRAVAKICLNSLWGKFGQRQNLSKTEYVTDIRRFYEILLDDKLDNINLAFVSENMVQMSYRLKYECVGNDFNTNVYIAAFTTSNARLRLYEMLDYLGENVAYYDTDSVFYIDDVTKNVKTGCLLGEWTDELSGNYITDWVSTGPKSYAYLKNKGNEICKIKGFFLNYETSQFLNYKTLTKMVKKECKGVTIVDENKITRDPKTKNIINKYQEKLFSFDYDKRVINKLNNEHIDTLPYGY